MTPYIRLSKRGWFIAVNAVLWYFIARVNHNLIALILAWGSMALLAISFLAAFFSLRRIRLSRGPVNDGQTGRLLDLPIRCENLQHRRRQPFIIAENLPFADQTDRTDIVPAAPARSALLVQRSVMPVKRGEYRLGELTLRDSDPAGLFIRERQLPLPAGIVIYPHTFTIHSLDLPLQDTANLAPTTTPLAAAGTSQEFYGVREYHPTDGMRHIHWRSTARYGKLMVREFERSTALTVAILVDAPQTALSAPNAANLECAVSLAASVCQYLADTPCLLAFAAGGRQPIIVRPGDAHLTASRLLYHLATLQAGDIPLSAALDDFLGTLPANAVAFCFSLSTDTALQDALLQLQERGLDVRWFVTRQQDFHSLKKHDKTHNSATPANTSAFPIPPVFVTPAMTADDIFA